MGIGLVTAPYPAGVWLLVCMNVAVFLAVGAVGESPVAPRMLASEWLLTWRMKWNIFKLKV